MIEGVQAVDKFSEENVISAMLTGNSEAIDCVEGVLGVNGSLFYIKLHELVYEAILGLYDADAVIDPTNVSILVDVEAIGMSISQLQAWLVDYTRIGDVWSIESIGYHAKKVKEIAVLREVDRKLRRLILENLTPDADLSSVYGELEVILEGRENGTDGEVISVSEAKEVYRQYVADIQKRKVNFGWPSIDKATRGLIPGDVCLIFARTNVGKSALAQSMQLGIWERQSIKSIFFSLEMPVTSIYERMASMVSGWEEEGIEGIFLADDQDRLLNGLSAYEDGVFFVEKSNLTLKDISRIARSVDNVGVIFIDYMGLVKAMGRSPYERLSNTATGLKGMAKDLGIAVVCICQLSRKAGDGTIPVSFDMVRDSGQIEEATDVILGMHKEEKDECIKLVVLKARRGRKGATCEIGFSGDTPKLVELYNHDYDKDDQT